MLKDILEVLGTLQSTSVPNLLVIAGFIFLLLAFVGRIGAIVTLPEKRQKVAGTIGFLLLLGGIGLFMLPPQSEPSIASANDPTAAFAPATPTEVPQLSPETPLEEPKPSPTTPPPEVMIDFIAYETRLSTGDCTTLKWDLENARHAYLDGIEVGGHGNEVVCPASTTTYTLRVEHATGTTERQITINVVSVASNEGSLSSGNIGFTYADDFGSGITIHSVTAQKAGENIEFQFDYTSDANRGMSFFDPPAGDTISIQESLPVGTNSVSITVPISSLQSASFITVNFYIPNAGGLTGSIFLNYRDIEKLLP